MWGRGVTRVLGEGCAGEWRNAVQPRAWLSRLRVLRCDVAAALFHEAIVHGGGNREFFDANDAASGLASKGQHCGFEGGEGEGEGRLDADCWLGSGGDGFACCGVHAAGKIDGEDEGVMLCGAKQGCGVQGFGLQRAGETSTKHAIDDDGVVAKCCCGERGVFANASSESTGVLLP